MKSVAVDTASVALVEHPGELRKDNETTAPPRQPELPPRPEAAPINDSVLQELAKRRLATKRSLIGQALDYLLLIFSAIWMVNMYYDASAVYAIFLCMFWGLRLAYRAYKYAQPSFKNGIAEYLRKRKEQQLEFEYNRLKQMSTEYVANELNR